MGKQQLALVVLLAAALLSACNASINDDIHVSAGANGKLGGATLNGDVLVDQGAVVPDSDFSTVNGNIRIEERAQVKSVTTVNGNIVLAPEAQTSKVQTVNGRFELGPKARERQRQLVNGNVSLSPGSEVGGSVETVNGAIAAQGATIDGDVANYSGGMLITDESVVKGSLTVHEPEDVGNEKPPRIVIGPHSKVIGPLKFERAVELYVHETAETGPIDGAEPIRYSGALPEET
jgi:carbonic anhydrase/acetyltransferase-like protein (isoleucine patch superfamily)